MMATHTVVGFGLDTGANRGSGRFFRLLWVLLAGWVAKVTTIGIFCLPHVPALAASATQL